MTDPDTNTPPARLRLASVAGPERVSFEIEPGTVCRIGRAIASEVCLLHQNVSRRHAQVSDHHGSWFVSDLQSRHGTRLNGVALEPERPGRLVAGDLIQVGPWTFRVYIGEDVSTTIATVDDTRTATQTVESLGARDLGALAQHRLSLLIECAAEINAVDDERELAELVLRAAIAGTGFARAAFLRPLDAEGKVELVASRSTADDEHKTFTFSSSLLNRAKSGELVRLSRMAEITGSHSIAELGIHSALCAPIGLDASVVAYLYLDARDYESQVRPDAAEFCQALARMCGLAMASMRRAELVRRQRMLESELDAAREAQALILPPPSGAINGIRYALRMKPGRIVAGDLFDVVPLDENRTAVTIGDVTGEGVGAALLMASAQAQLHAALSHAGNVADAMDIVNTYLVAHSAANRFISMWVGVFDRSTRSVRYVDAGHGHWMVLPHGEVRIDPAAAGIPLGIDETFTYGIGEFPLAETARVLLLSDGVIEQRSPGGEEFGRERIHQAIADSPSAEEDAERLLTAIYAFAETDSLDDDTTVAGIEWA